jgi:hypothetical protein
MATQLVLNPEEQPVFFKALQNLGTPEALALAHTAKEFTEETEATRKYRKTAQVDAYEDLQVDHTAAVSASEEGAWVSCWIWVPSEEVEPLQPRGTVMRLSLL